MHVHALHYVDSFHDLDEVLIHNFVTLYLLESLQVVQLCMYFVQTVYELHIFLSHALCQFM